MSRIWYEIGNPGLKTKPGTSRMAGPRSFLVVFGIGALRVVIHKELVWVRPDLNLDQLAGTLVIQVRRDQILGKDAALQQEGIVGLQRVERLGQRAGRTFDVCFLL